MSTVLVCLHGWGGSKESFTPLRNALENSDLHILTPDLPGFGDEPEPQKTWTVDDYADWVQSWITIELETRNQKPETIQLLGHSHGGRIAIKLAHRQSVISDPNLHSPISNLYLCAAAGIRHPRHFKRIAGLTLAKGGKAILALPLLSALEPLGKKLLYKLVRVHDYEKASEIMRTTLIEVSKEDLKPLLPTIRIPTDIFWGEQDGMTPIGDAYIIHDAIEQSSLHIYPEVRHGVHKDKASEIATVILESVQTTHNT